eukprot:scaffold11424_cov17-Tisochrysis_lutea.AAC.1
MMISKFILHAKHSADLEHKAFSVLFFSGRPPLARALGCALAQMAGPTVVDAAAGGVFDVQQPGRQNGMELLRPVRAVDCSKLCLQASELTGMCLHVVSRSRAGNGVPVAF